MWFHVFTFFANYAFFGVICLPQKLPLRIFFYKYQVWPSSPHYRHQYYHHQGRHILFMFLSPWCIVVKRAGATAGEVWRREGASPPTMGETSDLVWSVIHKRSLSFHTLFLTQNTFYGDGWKIKTYALGEHDPWSTQDWKRSSNCWGLGQPWPIYEFSLFQADFSKTPGFCVLEGNVPKVDKAQWSVCYLTIFLQEDKQP